MERGGVKEGEREMVDKGEGRKGESEGRRGGDGG